MKHVSVTRRHDAADASCLRCRANILYAAYSPDSRARQLALFPSWQHILNYEPPRGFIMPAFTMFNGSNDPYDHMLHYNQAMTLNADNDHLLCKVFPTSMRGPVLAWFHKLSRNLINSFNELWTVFISHYLCSVRYKRNISSLQTIIKQEEKSIRDFTRRFGQAVQQVEAYNMDAILQNFRRSFEPSTPFFHSLSLDLSAIMEELYRRADRYLTLEDNIRATTQTIMITSKPIGSNKSEGKKPSEPKEGQGKNQKQSHDQSQKNKEPPQFTPLNITYERLLPLIFDLPDFKGPAPIQMDPFQRNPSVWCDYHRDQGHETDRYRSLKFLVE